MSERLKSKNNENKEAESHFNHACRIVESWPEWKKSILITVSNSQFDIDGNLYKY